MVLRLSVYEHLSLRHREREKNTYSEKNRTEEGDACLEFSTEEEEEVCVWEWSGVAKNIERLTLGEA